MSVALRDLNQQPRMRAWLEVTYAEWLREMGAAADDIRASRSHVANLLAMPGTHAVIIDRDGEPVGFAVVRSVPVGIAASMGSAAPYHLLEFYVTPVCRRLGVGSAAARLLFDRFVGHWEIKILTADVPALMFWRRLLAGYAPGGVSEIRGAGEIFQRFLSRAALSRGAR